MMMNIETNLPAMPAQAGGRPNWKHVGAFLGLCFGLTWLLDLAIYLGGGLAGGSGVLLLLQLQMLLPAFSAIMLGLFAFPESPIYYRRPDVRARWFFYFFLALTVVYALGALGVRLVPGQAALVTFSAVTQLLALLGLILLSVLRFSAGREAAARVWLAWGRGRWWLIFALAIVAYYVLQGALNALTGLGGASVVVPAGVPQGMTPAVFVALGALQTVGLAPFLGLVIAFGEEYGWRGYLQSELFKLGRARGVLLLGVIWGMWHWPIILMGYNYPGRPLAGVLLMTVYTTGLSVVLSYAVLKSGSVVLASYLHALNNQVLSFIFIIGFAPRDPVFSFGIGLYGAAALALISLLILRDPIWKGRGGGLPLAEQEI